MTILLVVGDMRKNNRRILSLIFPLTLTLIIFNTEDSRGIIESGGMVTIFLGNTRGSTKTSWLNSKHTFSFGSYYDPERTNYGVLRVINEDVVSPSGGFQPHSHQNMEIISYVLKGELEHKDSLGNGSIIRPGEVQIMSAGTGITHSEFNPSKVDPVHFLQIWVIPNQQALKPSYQQKSFQELRKPGSLTLLASQTGEDHSLMIHQDVKIYVLDLDKEQNFTYPLMPGRMLWVQIAGGKLTLNDTLLQQGDGASVDDTSLYEFHALERCEILLFELNNRK
jgi:quercetin 2,3-dioxygenase